MLSEPIRNPILKRLAAALGASLWVESAESVVFGSHVLAARLVHWPSATHWWSLTYESLELPEASPCSECGRTTYQGRGSAQIVASGVGRVQVSLLLLGHDHAGTASRNAARSVYLVESMKLATHEIAPHTLAESSVRFASMLAPSSVGDEDASGVGWGTELDRYLNSMGHRLRTELTNLIGYSESLYETKEHDVGFEASALERIEQSGQMVVDIVDELEMHLVREHAKRNLARTLRKISMVLASSLELNEVILKIHECIAQITHFDRSQLYWVYDGFLELAETSTSAPVRLDINTAPFDQVFQNLPQIQYIARVDHEKNSGVDDACEVYNSWLCLPLMGPRGPIALITLESEEADSYGDLDLDLLNAFAHHAFLALSNARRYSETRRLLEFDPLTRALSRGHFFDLAQQKLADARRSEEPLCVMMFDVDHFKRVNDTHGHQVGDLALQHVVDHAQLALRPVDLLGRYGGEEFVVLLPGVELGVAMAIADRVRRRIEISEVETKAENFRVTISVGVAMYQPERDADLASVIQRADAALYRAKKSGRNQIVADTVDEDTVALTVEMSIDAGEFSEVTDKGEG